MKQVQNATSTTTLRSYLSRGQVEQAWANTRRIVDTETQHDAQHADGRHGTDVTLQVWQFVKEWGPRFVGLSTPEECVVLPTQRRHTDTG